MKKTNDSKAVNKARLENSRVIQKNLVYVIGLSPELAKENVKHQHYSLDIGKGRIFRTIWEDRQSSDKQKQSVQPQGVNRPQF